MVGLDAVVAFTEEIERQLGHGSRSCRRNEVAPRERTSTARAASCGSLRDELKRYAAGAAQAVSRVRSDAGAARRQGDRADRPVFDPDLYAARPRDRAASRRLPASRSRLISCRQRRQYQSGLLAWLRGNPTDPAQMRKAIAASRRATTTAACAVLVDRLRAVRSADRERPRAVFGVKQLAARIDLQIRRSSAASRRLPTGCAANRRRIRRDQRAHRPQVAERAATFQLAGLIPSPEVLQRGPRAHSSRCARSARAAGRREGRVAQVRVRAAREPAAS